MLLLTHFLIEDQCKPANIKNIQRHKMILLVDMFSVSRHIHDRMRQMADNAILLFYGMTGGIKSFLFNIGHDNATVAVL